MFYPKTSSAGQSFSEVRKACAESEGLPFSDVLSEEQIQRAFAEEGALFVRVRRSSLRRRSRFGPICRRCFTQALSVRARRRSAV